MLTNMKKKYIGDKAFYHRLLVVALPIVIQNAFTNFVNLLDNIMVGQLGTEQMSGVAIVNQLIFIFYLLIFGGLSGVGIFTAQYYGKNDDEGVRITFRYKLWLGAAIMIITVVVLMCFGSDLIQLYLNGSVDEGDPAATLSYAENYLAIIIFMIPAVYIGQAYCSTLRECGETFVPMVSCVTAVLVNLVLNYLLIFGHFGFPKMGVAGAAIATVVARYVEAAVVIVWSIRNRNKHTYFKGLYRTLLVPFSLAKKFFVTGMPLLINEGLWSIGIAMLAQAYSVRGLNVVAGQNIANTINNMFNVVFIAMGDAVAIIVGQHLGAGDMKKAKDEARKIIAFSVFSSALIGAVMFAFSGLFPKIYNTNDMARLIATHFIMVQAFFFPKDSFLHTSYFTIRAGGKTIITFLFDSFFMMVISVPLAYILVFNTSLGPAEIFALVHAADLIKCVIGYILIKKEIWMNNIVNTSS